MIAKATPIATILNAHMAKKHNKNNRHVACRKAACVVAF
jgi:hypothetical protein